MKNLKFLIVIIIGLVTFQNASYGQPTSRFGRPVKGVNVSHFQHMLKAIQKSCDYDMNFTGNTVRRRSSGKSYSYTFHDSAKLGDDAVVKNTLKRRLGNIAFSDRNFFQGNKDYSTVEFKIVGSRVDMIITSHTWGGGKKTIRNVNVKKESFGYFITGKHTNSRSTTYYTISIYRSSSCPEIID